jgi:transposase
VAASVPFALPAVRALVTQLILQLETLSSRVAQLEEQMGRTSRNSSKSPSSDGSCFKPPAKEKTKGSGRKGGGQDGHPGASRNLLRTKQCAGVSPHFSTTCGGCGEVLSGQDPEPHRHQVVDIASIELFVIEHQLHRLICPHCHSHPACSPSATEPFPSSWNRVEASGCQITGMAPRPLARRG